MQKQINSNRLFLASCMALVVTSMTFAIRANVCTMLGQQFQLSNEQMGWIMGTAFSGFAIAIILGGFLCDILGMGKLLLIAFVGHVAGVILTIYSGGFWSLYISTFFIGVANGMVEAACNPLVTTLYPNNKITMLNRFHVWFPGGIVLGGLIGYYLTKQNIGWEIQVGILLIPTAIYGFLFLGQPFPQTERVTSGVSYSQMLKACLSPLFIFMLVCMFITASTELGTNQMIDVLLKGTGISPILVLVFISGLMAMGRFFAGPVAHKLSPAGMLLFSAIFATLGLLGLSATSGMMIYVAAAVFAVGVCFFWPTMLGFVSENLPQTGAFGLSLIGAGGMLFVSFALPFLGSSLDSQTGSETLRNFAILPAILIIAFSGLVFYKKRAKTSEKDAILAKH